MGQGGGSDVTIVQGSRAAKLFAEFLALWII
jgi:hypothetical protein